MWWNGYEEEGQEGYLSRVFSIGIHDRSIYCVCVARIG